MASQNDVAVDGSKFRQGAGSEEVRKLNQSLIEKMASGTKWFHVGAAKYRDMRKKGETVFPVAILLDRCTSFSIPSREQDREIPCRLITPEGGRKTKAIFMYIHGGGWVLSDEESNDASLTAIAHGAGVTVISVGYRLAPEDPFPKGPEDCFDAAEWLIDHAQERFGAELQFIGGESAGGHLSLLTYFHIAESRPKFHLSGLVLNYGVFDMSFLPMIYHFRKGQDTLILDRELMEHYREAFCPERSVEQLRHPLISPLYHDLQGMDLPAAVFTCGTEDPLLDDTVMMSAKWQMAGGKATVKVLPDAPHGYTLFPSDSCPEVKAGLEANCSFIVDMTR